MLLKEDRVDLLRLGRMIGVDWDLIANTISGHLSARGSTKRGQLTNFLRVPSWHYLWLFYTNVSWTAGSEARSQVKENVPVGVDSGTLRVLACRTFCEILEIIYPVWIPFDKGDAS